MAQPPSHEASAQSSLAPTPGAAAVRVTNVTVRMGGENAPTKDDAQSDSDAGQKQKRKEAAATAGFLSDVMLVTSDDLRDAGAGGNQDDEAGRVNMPAIDFS
jgi:hypothetical protein